ncbi:MAG: SpoIID/LytB domain-containing protein [Holophaga sp.]|nr:SpoIID/LytB domain-containing protein [Holophaga sp.]
MQPLPVLALLATPCLMAAATPQVRVALDTQALEWTVSLEGGGELQGRDGHALFRLRDGEKLRIWWDSKGEADPTDEYRVQVGAPLPARDADLLIQKLKALGEQPEKVPVPDGGSWRVLTGHYPGSAEAEPLLNRLGALGYQELWVSTEKRQGQPMNGRALYAVTERYERRPLPNGGVRLVPDRELTFLAGKGHYRGRMEIFPNPQGRLTVVNTLDLETYLRGVVPKEMGAWEFPSLEALKAQAVAARTYAYVNLGKRAKHGYDLVDTVSDQVYGGRDGEQALTDRAVAETAGMIATYGGRPIQALFMANAGGATVDNTYVFGNTTPYLKGVSSYVETPQTLTFRGALSDRGDSWLSWEILRQGGGGLLPVAWLDSARMNQPMRPPDLRPVLDALALRLGQPAPATPSGTGPQLYLWMARSLGFDQVVEGMERPQDAAYLLGDWAPAAQDRPLATFLTRRGLVTPAAWRNPAPTLAQGLQVLGRLWQELEPMAFQEGTLLRDGEVRVKNGGPGPLQLTANHLLAEEAPGGSLRLVASSRIQVGDRVKWLPYPAGSPVLVRRLDPDGASLDRYNPMAHWKVELKEADLLENLRTRAGIHGLRTFQVSYNDQGRALELVVTDDHGRQHRFKGMHIRGLLGLKDNVFRFITLGRPPERRWIVYGRGWGHGVGMDQTGAYGLALEGASYDTILKHYYQGIQITPIGN